MSEPSFFERHTGALFAPATPEEHTISTLVSQLARLADRHRGDTVMMPAVEKLGSAIIVLLNGDVGKLDQSTLDRKVREIVTEAGGNGDEL